MSLFLDSKLNKENNSLVKIQRRIFSVTPTPASTNKWVFGGLLAFLQVVYSWILYYLYKVQVQLADLRLEQAMLKQRLAETTADKDAALAALAKVDQSYISWFHDGGVQLFHWICAGGPFG